MPELRPGDFVMLTAAPPSLLRGLPKEDQLAIKAIVGQPVRLAGYDPDGEAELEFTDANGDDHTVWVAAGLVKPTRSTSGA